MCAIPGWLVDFGFYKKKKTKFLMCGRHIASWMVDLLFLTKKSNCVCTISFVEWLTYFLKEKNSTSVCAFTGWLWILCRKTKLKIAWITWPIKVYALSVVDWLTLDFRKRQRKNFSCVAAILLVEWLTCDFWPKNQTVCAPFLWVNGWLSCNRKKIQTVVSFHSLTYPFCKP